MLWKIAILGGSVWLSGCAAATSPPAATNPLLQSRYTPAVATALSFDPPVAMGRLPDLDRADREPAAFAGFQSLSTEFYNIRTDDNQLFFDVSSDSIYQREAVSEKVGVIYR